MCEREVVRAGRETAGTDCDEYCCAPVAMVDATFNFPHYNRNLLSTTIANAGTNGSTIIQSGANVGSTNNNLAVGPRIALGLQCENWGLIGRYWNSASW